MADDLEKRVRELRARVSEKQAAKARADHEAAVAKAREEAARDALYAEFRASSIEEARADLAKTEDDLRRACAQAERELEEAGG